MLSSKNMFHSELVKSVTVTIVTVRSMSPEEHDGHRDMEVRRAGCLSWNNEVPATSILMALDRPGFADRDGTMTDPALRWMSIVARKGQFTFYAMSAQVARSHKCFHPKNV